jgi:hypothetical protein
VSGPAAEPRAFPWWLRLVGPALAAILLSRVDLREVASSLASVAWAPLAASLVLAAPLFTLKAWRWRTLLTACGRAVPLARAMWLYTIAAGAGSLTPGAIGDFWKGLAPEIGNRAVGLWTSAIDRLYDLAFLLLLGAVVATEQISAEPWREIARATLAVAVLGGWLARRRLLDLAASWLPRFPDAAEALERSAPAAFAATLAATLIALARFELLVVALGLPLLWPQSFVAFLLTSGVAALPLSVAGIGTRDLALLGYLRACGVPAADAVALSTLCLVLFLWNGVVAACLWLVRPAALGRR